MQVFKLVSTGFVDKVIVFDSLPERFLQGVRTRPADGFSRAWVKWLTALGSLRPVFKTETSVDLARNWSFKHTPIGKEPCFYVLEYVDINADKERWKQISDYVRQNVGSEVRLKEKLEDMAIQLAPNPNVEISVEPEDIFDPETGKGKAYIPVPSDVVKEVSDDTIVEQGEQIIVQEPAQKKRGRPKKVVVEA